MKRDDPDEPLPPLTKAGDAALYALWLRSLGRTPDEIRQLVLERYPQVAWRIKKAK
jgi:hypothetical protein